MEGKRIGNVWRGVRRRETPPLFNGPAIPPHPQDVVFAASAAPIDQPDLEFLLTRKADALEISGPGIRPVYVETKQMAEAKQFVIMLAQAFDAGRSWVTQAF